MFLIVLLCPPDSHPPPTAEVPITTFSKAHNRHQLSSQTIQLQSWGSKTDPFYNEGSSISSSRTPQTLKGARVALMFPPQGLISGSNWRDGAHSTTSVAVRHAGLHVCNVQAGGGELGMSAMLTFQAGREILSLWKMFAGIRNPHPPSKQQQKRNQGFFKDNSVFSSR